MSLADARPLLERADSQVLDDRSTRAEARRWYVLFVYSYLSGLQSLVWFTFGSVPDASQAYYTCTSATIDLLLNWGPICFCIVVPFASFLLVRPRGLQLSVQVAAAIVLAGTVIRAIPSWVSDEWRTGNQDTALSFLHIGQILNAAAGPLVMATPSLLSAIWFPDHERTTATAIAVLANGVGTAVGFLLGPWLAPDAASIPTLLYAEIGMAALPAAAIALHFPAGPAVPPSPAAAKFASDLDHGRVTPFFAGLGRIVRMPSLWLIVCAGGIQNGVSSAWQSIIPQILGAVGYSPTVAGYYGFASTVAGLVGCFACGRLADLYFPRRMKMLSIVIFVVCSGLFVWLTATLPSPFGGPVAPNGAVSIVSAITLAGFFQGALDPVPEGTSAGLLTFVYNFASLALLFVSPVIDLVWQNIVMTGSIIFCLVLACLVKEKYTRSDAEDRMRQVHKLDVVS